MLRALGDCSIQLASTGFPERRIIRAKWSTKLIHRGISRTESAHQPSMRNRNLALSFSRLW
jgi:hypothetical protein